MYIFRYLEIRGDVAMIDSNLPAKSEIGHHHMLLNYVYFDSLIFFFPFPVSVRNQLSPMKQAKYSYSLANGMWEVTELVY